KLIVLMALLPPVESFPASSRHRGTVVVEDLHDPASWIRSRPQRPNPPDEREDWPCPGAIWYYHIRNAFQQFHTRGRLPPRRPPRPGRARHRPADRGRSHPAG